jgi:hypothetical protein
MRHLKWNSLVTVALLGWMVIGCGGSGGSGKIVGTTAQTITFPNPGTQTAGTSQMLSTNASSDAVVTLTSATPSVCSVTGTTATFLNAGTCTIDAAQSGNSTYAPATQVAQSFTVNPAIPPNTSIYIAGNASSATSTASNIVNDAVVWKLAPGTPTATASTLSMPNGMTNAEATAVAVSGTNEYVVGFGWNNTVASAVYWLNNAATILPSSMGLARAYAIAISGGNVYVAGFQADNAGNDYAVLWVNGTQTTLPAPSGMKDATAFAIAVSGSDVYVAGAATDVNGETNGVLWVNGAATALPSPSGLAGNVIANSIAVSGGNVYVSGFTNPNAGNEAAVTWVNGGVATTLPIPVGDSAQGYGADAIGVLGGDVYVAGSGVNSALGYSTVALWQNGVGTSLPMPTNLNSSSEYASASGIGFVGSDVYLVGTAGSTATYWVNGGAGTLLPLPSNTYASWANAITVVTQ